MRGAASYPRPRGAQVQVLHPFAVYELLATLLQAGDATRMGATARFTTTAAAFKKLLSPDAAQTLTRTRLGGVKSMSPEVTLTLRPHVKAFMCHEKCARCKWSRLAGRTPVEGAHPWRCLTCDLALNSPLAAATHVPHPIPRTTTYVTPPPPRHRSH